VATEVIPAGVDRDWRYAMSFLDWLACACAGATERGPRAVRCTGRDLVARVAFAATAGHVLDFDDTFSDGVAHVSATCAPAALVLAAETGQPVRSALSAYAEGYEAMAAIAQASHPALYEAGWHSTAVCGPVGAAVAAGRLLGLGASERRQAVGLALLRTGGTRGAFGSDGKAIQVGLAAAAGVQAALLARGGASVNDRVIEGFERAFGARVPPEGGADGPSAIERTWIKLYPSCLGTHSPIEAAAILRGNEPNVVNERLRVTVHPTAHQAAHLDRPADGLEAKFSIPYCVTHTLRNGPPGRHDFDELDPEVAERSGQVSVELDASLPEFGARVAGCAGALITIDSPAGSPARPVSPSHLAAKVADLAGDRLEGALEDLDRPATSLLSAAGL
jgi:2-methylcitrate dehydratase PrpD